jgi:monovalent cation:H+ antiporter-2, CPA2 family
MHLDPIMPALVASLVAILGIGLLLRLFRLPYVVGYLIAGIILGPHGLALITDEIVLSRLGAIGVVMLMFFIGMEVSPKRLLTNWKVAVIGTLFQILVSVGCVWVLGKWLDWPVARSILLGFVISLSSTAVVLKILQDWGELDSDVGQDVLGVLLVQDLAIIPMLIIIGFMGGETPTLTTIAMEIIGGITMIGLVAWLIMKETIHLPLSNWLKDDQEMQVFAAFIICFGLALFTGVMGLSTALGAFAAGMLVATARETQWVHHVLEPFRVVFITLFFVSIGMLVNLNFLMENWLQIALLVLAVFLTNTVVNAIILRMLGDTWNGSLYAGALLSQIGEFSFVLAAVGLQASIITQYSYQVVIAVIAVSLLLSPFWIMLVKKTFKLGQHPCIPQARD